ncbi:MAG: HD domain-containing protein [Candidatus Baltobacteraceae bacterium]
MYQNHPLDARLARVLPSGSLYAVGGRVRDELRAELEGGERPSKDFDYVVTGLPIDELTARLAQIGRVDQVGASFSVLKLTLEGETVDIALPRRERSIGSGHREFAVQSGPDVSLEEDLGRRDFRMNMLARALPSGEIVDPYGGEDDIRARRIDIRLPEALREDPLRMLRAAQFAARFEYAASDALRAAMSEAAPLVATVSAERVHDELLKLLVKSRKPSIGFELLRETGVLAHLWPELLEGVGVDQNEWHAFDVWHHAMATVDAAPPGEASLRLAALLHDVGKPRTKEGPHFYRHEIVGADLTRAMLERFRFSNGLTEATEHLVRQHMYVADADLTDAGVRRFIRRIRPESLEHLFALRQADIAGSGLPKRDGSNEAFEARVRRELDRKPAFSVRDLAVSGNDVVGALVRRGEAPAAFAGDERVGAALRWLFEQVTDEPERNERTLLLRILEQYLDRARVASA